jgi:NCS1 family nucleobase:cation symporter-1
VGGVIVCDYLVVRRGLLQVRDLYAPEGAYLYTRGVNGRALIALAAGILVALAGMFTPTLRFLFDGAWFSAAIVSFALYWMLTKQ